MYKCRIDFDKTAFACHFFEDRGYELGLLGRFGQRDSLPCVAAVGKVLFFRALYC